MMVWRILACLICTLACGSSLYARRVHVLSHAELFKQAEIVLIVRPSSTRDSKAGDPVVEIPGDAGRNYLTPIVTRCKVLAVVKGDLVKKEVILPHYRLDMKKAESNGIHGILNGPSLVTFAMPKIDFAEFEGLQCDRDYLVFLKREQDGDFTFVTGQIDPEFSVFRLQPWTDDGG
jgi:hypothetical protein